MYPDEVQMCCSENSASTKKTNVSRKRKATGKRASETDHRSRQQISEQPSDTLITHDGIDHWEASIRVRSQQAHRIYCQYVAVKTIKWPEDCSLET